MKSLFILLLIYLTTPVENKIVVVIDTHYMIGNAYTENTINKIRYCTNGVDTISVVNFNKVENFIMLDFPVDSSIIFMEISANHGECFGYSVFRNKEIIIAKNQTCDFVSMELELSD